LYELEQSFFGFKAKNKKNKYSNFSNFIEDVFNTAKCPEYQTLPSPVLKRASQILIVAIVKCFHTSHNKAGNFSLNNASSLFIISVGIMQLI
jgi:hypothetical protein